MKRYEHMHKTTIVLIAVLLCNFLPGSALAAADDEEEKTENHLPFRYLPLTKKEMGEPFPLKKVKELDAGNPISIVVPAGPSGVLLESQGPNTNLVASGKDKNGSSWRVVIDEVWGWYVPTYKGDLDGNGIVDVVLMMPSSGNGMSPTVDFVALMFDDQGRPVPFEADGYFGSLDNGIDSLVDMNRDGRAELIYMNSNDGYWITNIYSCQNGRWSRVQGAFGKKKYPLFTRYTYRLNRKAVTPKPGRHPVAPDLSNDTPVF